MNITLKASRADDASPTGWTPVRYVINKPFDDEGAWLLTDAEHVGEDVE